MNLQRSLTSLLIFLLLGSFAVAATAQTEEIPRKTVEMTWDSGNHYGNGLLKAQPELAMSDEISVAGVPWMQLQFDLGRLGKGSRIEITSKLDGATQVLDATSFEEWNHHSAYFNGDSVEVRLYVAPADERVRVRVKEVVVGEWAVPKKSICGPSDNRVASSEGRVARIDPIGCTGWIISNGKLLTAGHCLAGSGNTTLSFNPPASLSNGTVQFPGPQDQYAINQGSFQFANGGVGNDWGVFSAANNSVTGLSPIQAQGSFNIRQDLSPSSIRITGFGTDSGSTNQTNQTHVGSNTGSSGTTMRYNADTTGGNSGSPVIDTATGEAVGIHSHGGCSSSGGNNSGTSFFRSALWSAINSGGGGGSGCTANSGSASNQSASTGNWKRYTWSVPSSCNSAVFKISGGSGDADLYMRFGSQPTTSSYNCRPYLNGNNETCTMNNPNAGTWHIGVRAYSTFSGVKVEASHN